MQGPSARNAYNTAYHQRYDREPSALLPRPPSMSGNELDNTVPLCTFYASGFLEFSLPVGRQLWTKEIFREQLGGKLPPFDAKKYSPSKYLYHPANNPYPPEQAIKHKAVAHRLGSLAHAMVTG